jgi:uncharacterized membrane protein (UPF0127 family)
LAAPPSRSATTETTFTSATESRLIREDGRVVCERLLVAARPFARMRGLLGRRSLDSDQGILLRPAGSVHTFFMRFAIDVLFLDRELVVVGIEPELRPWRTAARRGAKSVVELAAGECARRGVVVGDRLAVDQES